MLIRNISGDRLAVHTVELEKKCVNQFLRKQKFGAMTKGIMQ